MARPETPIDPLAGPLAAFAMELRKLRENAGVTYRVLAQRGHCSPSALSEAANGRQLPTWLVTEAFVKGCGADPQQWEARWQAVAAQVKGDSSTAAAPRNGGGAVAAPADSSDVGDHLPSGDVPPLGSITSPQDFHLALRALRVRAGNPSLRELSVLARKHGGHVLPRSTLAGALDRTDRLPSLEIVVAYLSACDVPATEVDAVKTAWTRVAYLLQRNSMPGSTRWQDSCPYRGLAAFQEDQAEVFYGREHMTIDLLEKLADRVRGGVGMLVVAGPSGAGKSSLLRAGLLPQLAKGALGPGSQDWPKLVITPGAAPLDELAVPLAQLAGVNSAEVRASLAEHPDAAHLNARQALLAHTAQHAGSEPKIPPSRLVLIVDQFEELFTATSDKAEGEAFITSLCTMAGVGRSTTELPPALVVLGLRADFLSDCTAYASLAEAMRSNVFVVGPMTEVELRSAITGPAEAAGLSIEAGLVDNVLAELRATGNAGGFDAGALPLLSQAMFLTWEHREGTTLTRHAYAAGGGLRNGIQTSAEAAYDNLTPAQQEAARMLFRRMVTFTDNGLLTRRQIPLDDLNLGSSTADDVSATLEQFTNKRLITLREDTAEIVHEVLVHTWQRLGSWINQDREWLRLSRELEGAVSAWEENGQNPAFLYGGSRLESVLERINETDATVRPSVQSFLDSSRNHERSRKRKLRDLRTLVSFLTVVAIFAGVSIFLQRNSVNLNKAIENASNSQLLATKHPEIAMPLAAKAFQLAETLQTRSALLSAQSQYFTGQLVDHTGHNINKVKKVAFSHDGRFLATASYDDTVQLWDVAKKLDLATNQPTANPDSPTQISDVEFTHDGRLLFTTVSKSVAKLWDVASRQPIATLINGIDTPLVNNDKNTNLTVATLSHDGHLIATASGSGMVQLWDAARSQQIATLDSPSKIQKIVFSPDDRILANADQDNTVQLWNVTDPLHPTPLSSPLPATNPLHTTSAPTSPTDYGSAVVFSHDGNKLATVSLDDTVRLWDVQDPHHPKVLTNPNLSIRANIVSSVMFSPDGNTLVTAGADGTAQLWDVATQQPTGTLRNSGAAIDSMAFHPDGHTIVTASEDGVTRLWEIGGPVLFVSSPIIASNYSFADIKFSPDGNILATVDAKGTSMLWSIIHKHPINMLAKQTSSAVAFSGDGQLLATAGTDGVARLWDIVNERFIANLTNSIQVDKVVFSPEGRTLATIEKSEQKIDPKDDSKGGNVQLWNVTNPSHPVPLKPFLNGYPSNAVTFSKNGRILATTGKNGITTLWDIDSQRIMPPLTNPKNFISKVVFSSDGKNVATLNEAGSLQWWEVATGKSTTTQRIDTGVSGTPYQLALSPDGRTVATTNSDETTTKLWDMGHDGTLTATLTGHTGPINVAAFNNDGDFLATASSDGTVRLWDLNTDRVTKHLCSIRTPATKDQWEKLLPGVPDQTICH